MAGEPLAHIECDGCGNQAAIKKLSNSPLLYLHCKKCGCDRRSGERVQAKWQQAVESPHSLDDKQESDWSPSRETHKNNPENSGDLEQNEDNQDNGTESFQVKKVITGVSVFLAISGMLFKAIKG
ncbi:hypothetical protein FLM48_11080 [Shewanella sp. Scap07]|uniref:hypothetical protein n=1 Tax=Shewanella sp. Scap07 TaxID=2589987 RepID=UPI0015C0A7EA|nr:hypothetical protein [Shewanella sp. Scap07]QLE85573.1 hypothetical protein FLM48_11080 [Shewanella sp. Scap07]